MCKKWSGCDPLVVKNDLTGAQIRLVNLFYLYPTLIDLETFFKKLVLTIKNRPWKIQIQKFRKSKDFDVNSNNLIIKIHDL